MLDLDLINGAITIAEAAQRELDNELAEITGGAVTRVTQCARLKEWLATCSCIVTGMDKGVLGHALTRKSLAPEVRRAIEIRRDGAHVAGAKFTRMQAWRCDDGRARGTLKYHGASTGRWSSFGIQLQNLPRENADIDIEAAVAAIKTADYQYVKSLYPAPLAVLGALPRAAIIAADGCELWDGDFSGIESRVLAWLANEKVKLRDWRRFDTSGDPATEPYAVLGKLFQLTRDAAKICDLAFQYQGGVEAYRKLTGGDVSEEQARARQRAWRQLHPQTEIFWHTLNQRAIRAVAYPEQEHAVNERIAFRMEGEHLKMRLPDGRNLTYPFATLIQRISPFGERHAAVNFKDNAGGKFVDCRYGNGAYGGLWCENATQAVARDVLAEAMQRLDAAGYQIILHVHDEIVCEVPKGTRDIEEFRRIVVEPPAWAPDLPLAVKVRRGHRFAKTNGAAA
jgi:DNA polymerase